jgi:hypothetical protein
MPVIGRTTSAAPTLPAAEAPDISDLGRTAATSSPPAARTPRFWQFLRRQANGDPEAGRALARRWWAAR